MPIYFTSLDDPARVDNVLAFLEPYVPHTLGLIGNIVNPHPSLVKAVKVYASFEIDFRKPIRPPSTISGPSETPFSTPPLFSIIVLRPREQGRFFCSADLKSSDPATPEEETHVQAFFKKVIPIVAAFPPDNEDGPTPEYDISPVGVRGRGYHVGRVHEKWIPCLDPITILRSGPVACFIRPPPPPSLPQAVFPSNAASATVIGEGAPPDQGSSKSDRWIISRFSPSDIDFVRLTQSSSLIPRHRAYLESRSHTSIVVHDGHLLDIDVNHGTTKMPNPVAWSIIQTDGSLGVLWVEPSHRGLGLGDLVLAECVNRSETYHGFSGDRVTGTGILGWQWADVSLVNTHSVRFFAKQQGWRIGWNSQWITFDPDVDPTTIDWSFRETPTEVSRSREWAKNTRILRHQPEHSNAPYQKSGQ
ncbi:hypothetical protein BJ322DRAFT_321821 [Thelephora terrestris]|uniref:N-acetyltransferase domain-containing protein n=1 Tax=Thelephora terrestris TaxID=56493 RepID=A0A9P6H912_9AGAM|nr:hypothetical protein BJ322DRAFT_321821 [Thelephora terrestris]